MSRFVKFTVPGKPMGKGRPRATRAGRMYTPSETANYENLVKVEFERQCPNHIPFAKDEPLSVRLDAFFPIPTSVSKKKWKEMFTGLIRPTTKPDIDNVIKICLDGCNGLVFTDDSSIVSIQSSKLYSDNPRVEITILRLEKPNEVHTF